MKIKAITAVSLGLSVLLSTSTALAQSGPDSMPPESPTPDGTMTPEPQPEVAPPAEVAPSEEVAPPEATESGADNEGTKLFTCGPNGAAITAMNARPGCHLLKVNSPPGVI